MVKVRLSEKERSRVEVLSKVKRGEMSLKKGAELLGLSYRQMLRVYERFESEGNAAELSVVRPSVVTPSPSVISFPSNFNFVSAIL